MKSQTTLESGVIEYEEILDEVEEFIKDNDEPLGHEDRLDEKRHPEEKKK